MDFQDVLGQSLKLPDEIPDDRDEFGRFYRISFLVVLVFDDENHVETGQNCRHEVQIIVAFQIVPSTVDRVRRGQDTAARIQRCGDTSLNSHRISSFDRFYRRRVDEQTLAIEIVCCSIAS